MRYNMTDMKKVRIFVLLFAVLVCLVACAKNDVPDDLFITVNDVVDAPAGEYTLNYSVNNFSLYENKYNLRLSAFVYDESNEHLNVRNNRTVTLEADRKYDVNIVVYGTADKKNFTLSAHYVIQTVHADRTVVFLDDDDKVLFGPFTVPYGGDFLDDHVLPEVPDPVVEEGSEKQMENKRWVVIIDNEETELLPSYLENIIYNVYIYPSYNYSIHAAVHTITFVANGGSETPVYYGNSATIPSRPVSPTKEGYTFVAWCEDEACTTYFPWSQNATLTEDHTLYAKWIENLTSASNDNLFSFDKRVDSYGNDYYRIRAYDAKNLYGNIVLPNTHNGLPVTEIEQDGFKNSHIESVYVPGSYRLDLQRAFFNCEELVSVAFAADSVIDNVGASTFSGCVRLENIDLPDSVLRITSHAFFGCVSLAHIRLPKNLVAINEGAFYGCAALTEVEIPDATRFIMESAFEKCVNLSSFVFGEHTAITEIEENVLADTNVTEVALPSRMAEKSPFADTPSITVSYY